MGTFFAKLQRDGFVSIPNVFSSQEIDQLKAHSEEVLNNLPQHQYAQSSSLSASQLRSVVIADTNWRVLSGVLGRTEYLDGFVNSVFANATVQRVIEQTMGEGSRLWDANIRESKVTDQGLELHQDKLGELGIVVFLDDVDETAGTTALIRGSHLWPVRAKATGIKYIPIRFLAPFITPATGRRGDVFLFFHDTWHGRKANSSKKAHSALMMSLYPTGFEYTPITLPKDAFDKLLPVVKAHANPYTGLTRLVNGLAIIDPLPTQSEMIGQRLIDKVAYPPLSPLSPWQLAKLGGPVIFCLIKTLSLVKKSLYFFAKFNRSAPSIEQLKERV
jgi:putative 2OG-Fe(II) oxygenase